MAGAGRAPRPARPITAVNVDQERYCPRVAGWGGVIPPRNPSTHRCSLCEEAVFYTPTVGEGPVTLVCTVCLMSARPAAASRLDLD